MTSTYPYLSNLIGAYLNQDYEYFGATVEAVVAAYCENSTQADVEGLRADVAAFTAEHGGDFDGAFGARYGFDFDPRLWDLDATTFLQKVLEMTSTHRTSED